MRPARMPLATLVESPLWSTSLQQLSSRSWPQVSPAWPMVTSLPMSGDPIGGWGAARALATRERTAVVVKRILNE